MKWDDEASCRGIDPEVFFPDSPSDPALAAKAICRGCPVRAQCLELALDARLDHGVWGGLTEVERRSLRRSRQRQARRGATAGTAA